MRIGTGYDIHPFSEGGELRLGGITVENGRSLKGHSDGDIVLHALTDAILGAAGQGDIGEHFPDTDPSNKGRDSSFFLRRAKTLLENSGAVVANLDLTLIIQEPVMSPYRSLMRKSIARTLGMDERRVNVKFKTAELMGPVGRGEAAECHAVVCAERMEEAR